MVEKASIDEAYMLVTPHLEQGRLAAEGELLAGISEAADIARRIKQSGRHDDCSLRWQGACAAAGLRGGRLWGSRRGRHVVRHPQARWLAAVLIRSGGLHQIWSCCRMPMSSDQRVALTGKTLSLSLLKKPIG